MMATSGIPPLVQDVLVQVMHLQGWEGALLAASQQHVRLDCSRHGQHGRLVTENGLLGLAAVGALR